MGKQCVFCDEETEIISTIYTGWAKSSYTVYYILYTYFWSTLYVPFRLQSFNAFL